jgi:hypothetical protein
MLRSAGFRVLDHPDPEVFICGPDGPPADLPAVFGEAARSHA